MKEINIVWSETFGLGTSLKETTRVLNEAIRDFVNGNVLSVEIVERNGQQRFWIYHD